MKKCLLQALLLLLCLTMCLPAMAEDCFTINVDTLNLDRLNSDDYVAKALSASTQGVRVCKQVTQSSETAAAVRLTLTQMNTGTLLFDRDYGYQSGAFDSGVIYLPYAGDSTIPYLVTLYAGDMVYAMPFMHLQRRLTYNSACTAGVRLRELDSGLGGDWLMGTMVDLNALRQSGSMSVEVCASNQYVIGTAHISMSGDSLCVELLMEPQANAEVHQAPLYVITDAKNFHNTPDFRLGDWVHVGSAQSALIYLPMQVSYDPAGLRTMSYSVNDTDVQRQKQLWQQNAGSGSADGWSEPETSDWNTDSGWDDGWSDGWDDGWDDGWSSGW